MQAYRDSDRLAPQEIEEALLVFPGERLVELVCVDGLRKELASVTTQIGFGFALAKALSGERPRDVLIVIESGLVDVDKGFDGDAQFAAIVHCYLPLCEAGGTGIEVVTLVKG